MTKSATSLLLGAALATVFFLLYTSVCRDLGDGPPKSSPPRWAQEQGTANVTPATKVVDAEQGTGRPARQEQEVVAPREEKQTKDEAASRSGDGGGGAVEQQQNQQRIVMPTSQQDLHWSEADLPGLRSVDTRVSASARDWPKFASTPPPHLLSVVAALSALPRPSSPPTPSAASLPSPPAACLHWL